MLGLSFETFVGGCRGKRRMKRNRSPTSNPLASIDDIQKRLIRPSYILSSQPSSASLDSENLEGHESSQLKVNSTEFERKQEITRRKVEDYLDPALLSAICAKIGCANKEETTETKLKKKVKDFEWPVDELKAFMEEHSRSETRSNLRTNRAVDLSHDVDLIEGCSEDEDVNGQGEFCTPFRLFEESMLKRFRE